MDLEALGNVGEIIGAVAVIFSILYLARQISRSTALVRAENQRELLNTAHLFHPLATIERVQSQSDQLYVMTDLWHFYREPPESTASA